MSDNSTPVAGRPARRQRARTLSYLFLAGGAIGLCALVLLPLPPDTSITGTAAVVAFSLTWGTVLFLGSARAPEWVIPLSLVMGTIVVSCDVYFAGRTPTSDEVFYVWVVFYAAYFLGPRLAAIEIAFVAIGYAVALLLRHAPDGATRWVVTVGTMSIVSVLITRLVAQLDAAARTSAEREHALREAKERFRSSFENAAIGMATVDLSGRWSHVNEALSLLLGFPREQLVGMRFQDLTAQEDVPQDLEAMRAMIGGSRDVYRTEKRYRNSSGNFVWVILTVSVVRDVHGEPLHFISQMQDISERKSAERELTRRALHDSLTGLPNRALFLDRANVALARTLRERTTLAILFLDIDRFKLVNDSLGHAAGDRLLVEVAKRLEQLLRPSDTVARFGGDEFTILCESTGEREASQVADRIEEVLAEPITIDGQEVFASASIGIAIGREGAGSAELLLGEADAAMYRAKETGRARHAIFDGDMRLRGAERLTLENELRRAMARKELLLEYSPIVSLASRQIEGLEARVCWQHPVRGMLAAEQFIPIAEDSGLIVPLGEWALRDACAAMARWRRSVRSAARLSLAVNVSRRQLVDAHFCAAVAHALEQSGLDAECLRIEVAEDISLRAGWPALNDLRGLGVRLALNHVGAGLPALSHIRQLPAIDILKIGPRFTHEIAREATDLAIVSAIVETAHAMDICTLAEGVESEAQVRTLHALGCDAAQGSYFARPAYAAEVPDLLQSAVAGELAPSS